MPRVSAAAAALGDPRLRHALAFILVTVLIDTIGFGIVIPVLPKLVMTLTGKPLTAAARISGYLMVGYAAMQFVFGPVMGALSDRFGRRPVLLASLLAFSADYFAMAFAPTIAWLFAGRLIAGVTGASFNTAYAFIADVTPPERRAANFGLIGLGFGIGFVIGPALGGILAHYGTRVPFLVAAGLALLNAAYGWFILPESLGLKDRRRFEWRRANAVGSLLHLRAQRPVVLALAAATFLTVFASMALQSVWTFYTIARFRWTPAEVGYSLAAVGVSAAIIQGGLLRWALPRYGEHRLIVVGSVSAIIAYATYAAATSPWMFYAGIAAGSLSGFVYPSLQALMSAQSATNEQGELQGAVSSLFSLANISGPAVMTALFVAGSAPDARIHFPGAPFALAAVCIVASLVIFELAERRGLDPRRPAP